MAPFTVTLEHPIVVPVVAVRAQIGRLDRLLRFQPFLLALPLPVSPLDELFFLTFHQLLLRFQPELDTVSRRLSSGLPFLVGIKPNVLVRNHLSIVIVVAGGNGCFGLGRWVAWTSVFRRSMFVVALGHNVAPFLYNQPIFVLSTTLLHLVGIVVSSVPFHLALAGDYF
jgi:hypothetical protein